MTDFTLGQRIAAKRNELGLSQSALGEQLGVSRQSVFKWESDAAIPEIDKLIALSKLFGVSLDWLMGIGDTPRTEAPGPEKPQQDFTERERQILEQFANRKAVLPHWLKAMAIVAVACASVAMINSCISLYQSSRARAQAREIQTQSEQLMEYIQAQITPSASVVQDFTCQCTPSLNLDSATALLRITPYYYEKGHSAAVIVLLGEEVVAVSDCNWNGASWETELDLKPANGYRVLFRFTDGTGTQFDQELNAPILNTLAYHLAWPTNYAVTWKKADIQRESLTFTDMSVKIPLPGIFYGWTDLWERCDLVLTNDDGDELCRFDLMHRSAYSAKGNFGGDDVDFTTQSVYLEFAEPELGEHLHLTLDCALTTGHQFFCPVEEWIMSSTGLTTMFQETRS